MAGPALASFLVSIGFSPDRAGVREVDNAITGISKNALKLGSILAGAFSFNALTAGFAAGVDATAKMAANLGVAADRLSAINRVGQLSGLAPGAVTSMIAGLTGLIAEYDNLQTRQGVIEGLHSAGLPTDFLEGVRTGEQALLRLEPYMRGVDHIIQQQRLGGLGLPLEAAQLYQGNQSLESRIRERQAARPILPGDAEAAARYNDEILKLGENIGALADQASRVLIGPVTDFVEGINTFIDKWQAISSGDPEAVGNAVTGAAKSAGARLLPGPVKGARFVIENIFNLDGKEIYRKVVESEQVQNAIDYMSDGTPITASGQ